MLDQRFREFHPGADDAGKRLDRVLRRMLPDVRLGEIFALIRNGKVRINGRKVRGKYRLTDDDVLQIEKKVSATTPGRATRTSDAPKESAQPPRVPTGRFTGVVRPGRAGDRHEREEDIPDLYSTIVFENKHLLCINKPRGIAVHGPSSCNSWVKRYLRNRLPASLSFRSGPLHRIDRNTTGIVFFGKSAEGARRLSSLIHNGKPRKVYLALMSGSIRKPAIWEDRLERDKDRQVTNVSRTGARAITSVYPILWTDTATLALCTIVTGRTHQIRSQAAHHGHPLLGDGKYGGGPGRYALHALTFMLPERDSELGFHHVYAEPPDSVMKTVESHFGSIPPELILQSVDRAAKTL